MNKQIVLLLVLLSLIPVQLGYSQARAETSLPKEQEAGPKLDIVLVLDNSGSMMKNDPNFLTLEVVTNFLSSLGKESRLGMVIFDKEAHLIEPLKDLISSVAKAKFLKNLETVNYKGRLSDSPAAIERALYELKTNGRKDARKIIILLTDGIVDTGDPQKDLEKEKWLKEDLAFESKKEKIRIFGIAFTDKADFSLIQALAFKTDGEYYRAFKATEINNVFNKINAVINRAPVKPLQPASVAPPEPPPPVTAKPAAPALPPVEPAPVRESTSPPPQRGNRLLIYILAGLSVFLGTIVIIMALNRRSKTRLGLGLSDLALQKASRMPRAELIDVKNITSKQTVTFGKRINKIGRDANNDVAIPNDTVSSFHATIEYRDGSFYLEDQRSKNKTFLNGEEVEPHSPQKLKSGDVISFNIYKFIFLLPDLIPAGKTVMDFGAGAEDFTRTGGAAGRTATPIRDITTLPRAILIDIKNITSKKTTLLEKTLTKIGRGVHNDADIPKTSISGSHATIEYKNGFYYLEDQRSKNKTHLNGEVIEPYVPKKLKSGDEIRFDVYNFIFLLERQTPTGDTKESL
ncbi:FHA domain-containing protein [Thermodesulfobacteriota bacterium]